jgi:predicted GIY-YIG superfamily endonuclease
MHPTVPATGRPRSRASFRYFADLPPEPQPIVYLYHLDPPYKHAAHYLGSTDDLDRRDAEHGGPEGARLLQVQEQAGGSWHLVRTWAGGRQKESELKSNNGKRYCPECTDYPLPGINTKPRQRKTRNQRRREQLAAARSAQQPEPMPRELMLQAAGQTPAAGERLTADELARQLRALDAVQARWPRQAPAALTGSPVAGGYR